jgi:hypothetical protein
MVRRFSGVEPSSAADTPTHWCHWAPPADPRRSPSDRFVTPTVSTGRGCGAPDWS